MRIIRPTCPAFLSGLGFDLDVGGAMDSAISDASSVADIQFDASLGVSNTDNLINSLFSPTGQKKDLANLNIFGADTLKEVGLWDKTGQTKKNQLANTALQSLSNVTGAVVKKLIPDLPSDLANNIQLFNQVKQARENQINQQVQGMQVNVENQRLKALALQEKMKSAKSAIDIQNLKNLLLLQQKQLAAARAQRDLTASRKASVINEELAKKEKYKNIGIGAAIAAAFGGGAWLLLRGRA